MDRKRIGGRYRTITTLAVTAFVATLAGVAGAQPSAGPAAGPTAAQTGSAAPMVLPVTDDSGRPMTVAEVTAAGTRPHTADDLQEAYRLPSDLLGARQTIAVVVPFDHPNAESDLAVYREENGLPPCTADFPCFRKVNQRGGDTPPRADQAWALSAATGLQLASASCPNCRLLLVEADDDSPANVGVAVDQAAELGADVIAVMYGALEYGDQGADAVHYDHPGIPITAPSGNSGFPTTTGRQLVPAAYDTVIAVGGTTLYREDNERGWAEEAWFGSGSGCSAYVPSPYWQREGACGDKRTVADVAAVASLTTPVAVYDSYGYPGWVAVGGTPIGAALISGVYALAGNADDIEPGRHLYRHGRRHLFDITSGSTGDCGGSNLCTAGRGYDGPTGLGTPNGIGAF